jgi:8-oxo-dGTP diphosphatase
VPAVAAGSVVADAAVRSRRLAGRDMELDGSAVNAPGADQVVAALVVRDGRALLCHRSPERRWYPDVWDLAGGHVEAGESPAGALVRELREELGVIIPEPSGPELARFVTAAFDMRVWLVRSWTGELSNAASAEHDRIAWFEASELAGLRLADDCYVSLITRVLADPGSSS